MKCQKVTLLFTEYYDDELSQEIRSTVRKHLDQCEDCKAKHEEFKKSLKILKRLKPLD